MQKLNVRELKITDLPTLLDNPKNSWIEGDLHANPLRLIRVLVEHGIINALLPIDWEQIYKAYYALPEHSMDLYVRTLEIDDTYYTDALQTIIGEKKYSEIKELVDRVLKFKAPLKDAEQYQKLMDEMNPVARELENKIRSFYDNMIDQSKKEKLKQYFDQGDYAISNKIQRIKTEIEKAMKIVESYESFAKLFQSKMEFKHHDQRPDKFVTLIGDDLADRGQLDFFILSILNLLNEYKVNYEVLDSNHSQEYALGGAPNGAIQDYFFKRSKVNDDFLNKLVPDFYAKNLGKTREECLEDNYTSKVVPFSVAYDENKKLMIKSHGPFGSVFIYFIAVKLGRIKPQETKIEDFFQNEALIVQIVEQVKEAWKGKSREKLVNGIEKIQNYQDITVEQLYCMSCWTRGSHKNERLALIDYIQACNLSRLTTKEDIDKFLDTLPKKHNISLVYGHDTYNEDKSTEGWLCTNQKFGMSHLLEETESRIVRGNFTNELSKVAEIAKANEAARQKEEAVRQKEEAIKGKKFGLTVAAISGFGAIGGGALMIPGILAVTAMTVAAVSILGVIALACIIYSLVQQKKIDSFVERLESNKSKQSAYLTT